MVGVYDHLTLGQAPAPAQPPPRSRPWTREEKFAAAGLALSAVSLIISYYWAKGSRQTNPCAECAGKKT